MFNMINETIFKCKIWPIRILKCKFDKLGIQYFDVVYVQLDAKYLGGKYGHIGMESLDVQYHQLDTESWMAFS